MIRQVLPLLPAVLLGLLRTHGPADTAPAAGLWCWLLMLSLTSVFRIYGGFAADKSTSSFDEQGAYDPVLDMHHFAERYELIILIFMGECAIPYITIPCHLSPTSHVRKARRCG